jgi:RNA polymerase sigma factor (sigma-70 family)
VCGAAFPQVGSECCAPSYHLSSRIAWTLPWLPDRPRANRLQVSEPDRSLKGVVQDAPVTEAKDSLERLYRDQGAKLWRALFAFSGDREVASDALAEAFTQALGRGAAIAKLDGWVWTVAFRIASGELKTRSHSGPGIPDRSYEMPVPVTDMVLALAKLSPKQRLAVVLHDYADRPTDEVARVLGASRATVHVHLSKGRRRLRSILGDDIG